MNKKIEENLEPGQINPRDLRIGNIVSHWSGIREIIGISVDSVEFMPEDGKPNGDILNEIHGILAHERWLTHLGFEKISEDEYKIQLYPAFAYLFITISDMSFGMYQKEEDFKVGKYPTFDLFLDSVHQIQNVYSAYTGKELNISPVDQTTLTNTK
jgi:hypothetical protein